MLTLLPAEGWAGPPDQNQCAEAAVALCKPLSRPFGLLPPTIEFGTDRQAATARTLFVLEKHGYKILDPDFARGGNGVAMFVLGPDGLPYIAKGSFDSEQVRGEASFGDRAWALNQALESNSYFLKPELIEVGRTPVLITRLFPKDTLGGVPAPTLRKKLKAGELDVRTRTQIFAKIIDAVTQMHASGIIHRDLKPQNVLVNDAGEIRIIDFGDAAQPGKFSWGEKFRPVGTRNYMSYGQARGEKADPVDDLTALRKIAWDVFTSAEDRNEHLMPRGPFLLDYAHAPEVADMDPKIAIAAWSRLPKTASEYQDLFSDARTLSTTDFYKMYGKKLAGADLYSDGERAWLATNAALHILESHELIKRFPDGLGLSSERRDAVIRAVLQFYQDTKSTGSFLSPPHARLYFDEFFERLDHLQRSNHALSDREYQRQLGNPSIPYTWTEYFQELIGWKPAPEIYRIWSNQR